MITTMTMGPLSLIDQGEDCVLGWLFFGCNENCLMITTMRMGPPSLIDQGHAHVDIGMMFWGCFFFWCNYELTSSTVFSDGMISGGFTSWIESRALAILTQPTSR